MLSLARMEGSAAMNAKTHSQLGPSFLPRDEIEMVHELALHPSQHCPFYWMSNLALCLRMHVPLLSRSAMRMEIYIGAPSKTTRFIMDANSSVMNKIRPWRLFMNAAGRRLLSLKCLHSALYIAAP